MTEIARLSRELTASEQARSTLRTALEETIERLEASQQFAHNEDHVIDTDEEPENCPHCIAWTKRIEGWRAALAASSGPSTETREPRTADVVAATDRLLQPAHDAAADLYMETTIRRVDAEMRGTADPARKKDVE